MDHGVGSTDQLGNNEYRTIIFTIDTQSFMESKRVLFLNSFLKKGTKQYQHLTEKYGEKGSPSREEFEAKAKAWYYAKILRDERKRLSSYERSLRDLDEGRVFEYDSLDDLIKEIEH